MRVIDFVQANKASDGIPATPTRQVKLSRAARERQAELAAVSLTPSRSARRNHAPPLREYHGNSQREETAITRLSTDKEGGIDAIRQQGDPFDTDLDGIDDSTTTMSVEREPETGFTVGGQYSARGETNLDAALTNEREGYKSMTDRLKELDSDGDEESAIDTNHHEEQCHVIDLTERTRDEKSHDRSEGHPSDQMCTKSPAGGEKLSWQKIEAILREDSHQQADGIGDGVANNLMNQKHGLHQPQVTNRTNHIGVDFTAQFQQERHSNVPRITPRPIAQRLSTRSRFAARPHFAAPELFSDHAPDIHNPEKSPERSTDIRSKGLQYTDDDHDQPQDRGVFDAATDLSILECSDDDGFAEIAGHEDQAIFRSSHLSTASATSSKRPFPNFTSDYPPNILKSKPFSDLQAESFDYNPIPIQPIFQQGPNLSLEDRFSRLKTLTDDQRRVFFSSLTLSEWETCGDWLIEQFCAMLQKSKEARLARRNMASAFEEEVKRRHDSIEDEGKSIKSRLENMRAGGLGVLKGQTH